MAQKQGPPDGTQGGLWDQQSRQTRVLPRGGPRLPSGRQAAAAALLSSRARHRPADRCPPTQERPDPPGTQQALAPVLLGALYSRSTFLSRGNVLHAWCWVPTSSQTQPGLIWHEMQQGGFRLDSARTSQHKGSDRLRDLQEERIRGLTRGLQETRTRLRPVWVVLTPERGFHWASGRPSVRDGIWGLLGTLLPSGRTGDPSVRNRSLLRAFPETWWQGEQAWTLHGLAVPP